MTTKKRKISKEEKPTEIGNVYRVKDVSIVVQFESEGGVLCGFVQGTLEDGQKIILSPYTSAFKAPNLNAPWKVDR